MIISALMTLVYSIFNIILAFELPNMSGDVLAYFEQAMGYVSSGLSILANYAPVTYLVALFGIISAVDIGIGIYHFALWLLKKIPIANIK